MLPSPEIAGTRITGFAVASFNFATALMLPTAERLPDIRTPEVVAPANPGDTNVERLIRRAGRQTHSQLVDVVA